MTDPTPSSGQQDQEQTGGKVVDGKQAGGKQAEQGTRTGATVEASQTEGLKLIGGLLALVAGLVALIVVVAIALIVKPDTTGGAIATSAVGVVGSIVGAYFGVKVGTDGTKDAIKANEGIAESHQEEAIKAQVFALHVPPEKAAEVVEHLKALGAGKSAGAVEQALSGGKSGAGAGGQPGTAGSGTAG